MTAASDASLPPTGAAVRMAAEQPGIAVARRSARADRSPWRPRSTGSASVRTLSNSAASSRGRCSASATSSSIRSTSRAMKLALTPRLSVPAPAAERAADVLDGLGELRRVATARALLDQVGEQRRRAVLAGRVAERAAAHRDVHRRPAACRASPPARRLRAVGERRALERRQLARPPAPSATRRDTAAARRTSATRAATERGSFRTSRASGARPACRLGLRLEHADRAVVRAQDRRRRPASRRRR